MKTLKEDVLRINGVESASLNSAPPSSVVFNRLILRWKEKMKGMEHT